MEFEDFQHVSQVGSTDINDLRNEIQKYTKYKFWYLASLIIAIVACYLYLKSEQPRFEIKSTILVKDMERGSSITDMESFEDLGLFSSNNSSLENEIHLLRSRRLMKQVVKELNLNVRYSLENKPYNIELFSNLPFLISFVGDSAQVDLGEIKFTQILKCYVSSKTEYELFDEDDKSKGVFRFGQTEETDLLPVSFQINPLNLERFIGKNIYISINPVEFVADNYNSRMLIDPMDERSRVLEISLRETIIDKGIAIINNLVEQYNRDAIEDKNQIHIETIQFLDDRLEFLTRELSAIEGSAEEFKRQNRMIDSRGAEMYLQSSTNVESELINTNTTLRLIEYMLDELSQKKKSKELLPSNVGLSESGIQVLISEYNELVLRRNRIIKTSSEINPIIVSLDSQLGVLIQNLETSLENLKLSTEVQVNALSEQTGKINSRISAVPRNERMHKDIVRQLETKNVLYSFLLQKREETDLARSVNINRAKIVDSAFSTGRPVSPKKKVSYLAAIFIALLIPTGLIFLFNTFDTKIKDENILRDLGIPFLGSIPLSKEKGIHLVKDGVNSVVAEAYRYVRSNLGFMLDRNDSSKTILVTSTLSAEGKTFTSINLASSIALTGKKTLLMGLDLRAPKINKYLGVDDSKGVTEYILNPNLRFEDIVQNVEDNLYLVSSGSLPPNPVELLMNSRVSQLFDEAKREFDYLIVDTSPVGLVSDILQLTGYADLTIYVVRSHGLDKKFLNIPRSLYVERKLDNLAILLNGVKPDKDGYGYGYGYEYGKKKNPWYKIF